MGTTARRIAVAAAAGVLVSLQSAAAAQSRTTPLTHGNVSHWAYVLWPVRARAQPSPSAQVLTVVRPITSEGERNLVLALASRSAADGSEWVRVRLAILPNNSVGWVPRAALDVLHADRTHLVIDRQRLTAVLYREGRPVFRAPVGVGQPQWPTPTGSFYVREKLTNFDDPFYGPVAFGTSARSAVLTDWPGGGVVGIHGTDEPDILPGRVSHGCIRMENANISRLAALMPIGTPITIR